MPESPTIESLSRSPRLAGFILFFNISLSTNSLPQPSGRLSLNTPKSPSKGSILGMNKSSFRGRENGLIENPVLSHSLEY